MGFVSNPIASEVGIFQTNWAHNLVHLVTGTIFLIGIIKFPDQEKRFVLYSGYFYGLMAVLGFVWPGEMLLWIIHLNEADRWLHLGLAIAIVAAGFVAKPRQAQLKAEYN